MTIHPWVQRWGIKDVSMFHIRDTKGLEADARLFTSYYIFKACRLSSVVLAPIYNVAWGRVSAAKTAIVIYTTSYSKLVDQVRLHVGSSIFTSIEISFSLSSKHSTHRRWLCSSARTRRFVPQYVPTCGLWNKTEYTGRVPFHVHCHFCSPDTFIKCKDWIYLCYQHTSSGFLYDFGLPTYHFEHIFVIFTLRRSKVILAARNGTRQLCPFREKTRSIQPVDVILREETRRSQLGDYKSTHAVGLNHLPRTSLSGISPRDRPLRLVKQWVKQRRQPWSCKTNNGVSRNKHMVTINCEYF